jgi:hypothetical protein
VVQLVDEQLLAPIRLPTFGDVLDHPHRIQKCAICTGSVAALKVSLPGL